MSKLAALLLLAVASASAFAARRVQGKRLSRKPDISDRYISQADKIGQEVDVSKAASDIKDGLGKPLPTPSTALNDKTYNRATELLGGDSVSARQVVNALGRWKSRTEWNDAGIGQKRLIDDFRNGDYYEEDLPKMKTDFSKPMRYYIARRPQFMDFCERYGLVARWVHRENVGSLPFPDDEAGRALAASVGATVEELNAEPVDEVAADVLFDAIADTGLMGFAEQEEVDRKRASFIKSDGSFNADVFGSSLTRSRANTVSAKSVVWAWFAAPLLIGSHYLPQIMEMKADIDAQVAMNWELHPWTLIIPVLPILGVGYRAATFVPACERPDYVEKPRPLNYQEVAVKRRDDFYMEKMRLKKSGQLEEATAPKFDELFKEESLIQKMMSGKAGMKLDKGMQPRPIDPTDPTSKSWKQVRTEAKRPTGPQYYVGLASVGMLVAGGAGAIIHAAQYGHV